MDDGKRLTTLAAMPSKHDGIVVDIRGGRAIRARLGSLGVRPGKRIVKLSEMLMHGPVMVEVDRAQVAVGFDVASRVVVSLSEVGIDSNTVDGKS
ncbi:ferrous iron transport protein A [Chloroflexota bacterium]